MRESNGFIQTPLLIIIIASLVTTVAVGGFVLYKTERSPLSATISESTVGDESNKVQEEEKEVDELDAGISKTQAEIERLKKEQELAKTEADRAIAEAERIKVEQELQRQKEELNSASLIFPVKIIPQSNFVRIEWSTKEPGESKIFIWPASEQPGYTSFTSPSGSLSHYVEIGYEELPPAVASIVGEEIERVRYGYKIETNGENGFAEKEGTFSLEYKISAINIEHEQEYLKIEWETNIVTTSKLSIWPTIDSDNVVIFKSPLKSKKHKIEIDYGSLPLYPKGYGYVENLLAYEYAIEAAGNVPYSKRGASFNLNTSPTSTWMSRIFDLNPNRSCEDLGFTGSKLLACKNYVNIMGL